MAFDLHCSTDLAGGLFKAYTMLGVQNRGCNLLQCGSGKRAREHKQEWRVTTLLEISVNL